MFRKLKSPTLAHIEHKLIHNKQIFSSKKLKNNKKGSKFERRINLIQIGPFSQSKIAGNSLERTNFERRSNERTDSEPKIFKKKQVFFF